MGDLFDAAVSAHRQGRVRQAEKKYRQVLKINPKHWGAHYYLGKILLEQGFPGKAIEHLRRACDLKPDEASLHFDLGRAHAAAGDLAQARKCLERSAAVNPGKAATHLGLGDLLRAGHEIEAALESYRRALTLDPDFTEAFTGSGEALMEARRYEEAIEPFTRALKTSRASSREYVNLGRVYLATGKWSEAEAMYREALRRPPMTADVFMGLGEALEKQKRPEEAAAVYFEAVKLAPGSGEARHALARGLANSGRHEEALPVYAETVRLLPDAAAAWSQYAAVEAQLGHQEAAIAAADKALALDPYDTLAWSAKAVAEMIQGRFDECESHMRQALALQPGYPAALYVLASIGRLRPGDGDIETFERMLTSLDPRSNEWAFLALVIAGMYEKKGQFRAAFAHFSAAAKERSRRHPFDVEAYRAETAAILSRFDQALVERLAACGSASAAPIIVTGMPRSGTTLVEQILASHSAVAGGGELEVIAPVMRRLWQGEGAAGTFAEPTAEFIAAASAEIGVMFDAVRNGAPHVTDKSISNHRYLGMIAMLFPNAKFIHCERDPRDICLSCFTQFFAGGAVPYTADLEHLAVAYNDHERLMAHWRRVLPGRILGVRYETLVADQEAQIRRLIDFCGLVWEDACLAFYKSERRVQTVSVWQVRQPVYASSIGKWKNYAEELRPFLQLAGIGATPEDGAPMAPDSGMAAHPECPGSSG